jgi:hypothetical protein
MENCGAQSIYKTSLRQFANKTLVIDTSIYLYKFAEKNAVAENMYLMISVFRQHNITPVFIFDGKPPPEKKALLIKRKLEKDTAEERYNLLKSAVNAGEAGDEAYGEMESLKRQFVRVTETDIVRSKEIMRAYGVPYIESRGESDHLCAFLVKHGFAWACVSDDMDMFLYGCPRVIRHLSLLHNEGMYYDTASILKDLDMTQEIFNDIAILSGTDYNINAQKTLSDTVRLYMDYREWAYRTTPAMRGPNHQPSSTTTVEYSKIVQSCDVRNCNKTFYQWLTETTEYIQNKPQFESLRKMFDLDSYLSDHRDEFKSLIDSMPFRMGEYNVTELRRVLREDGFIFA